MSYKVKVTKSAAPGQVYLMVDFTHPEAFAEIAPTWDEFMNGAPSRTEERIKGLESFWVICHPDDEEAVRDALARGEEFR